MGAGAAAKKKRGRVVIECDELWSFVGSKRDVWWVWVALDADSRQVVALVIGDRSEATAECLWEALPERYRAAEVRTDFWAAYAAVVPAGRHTAAGKGSGLTNHVERFFGTLRQRCARLVRKTLSFSKKVENHLGALWYFVRLYNACRL